MLPRTIQESSDRFAKECGWQAHIGRLNVDAVNACFYLDQNDPECVELAPQAVAFAYTSLRGLLLAMNVHAYDLEDLNAHKLAPAD